MNYSEFHLNNQPDEKWKKYPKQENIEVSNYGRIIKKLENGKFYELNKVMRDNGYLIVTIGYETNEENKKKRINKKVHRMVAETWLENNDNKKEVDHINRDRTDNRLSNLRWTTHKENMDNNTNKLEKGKKVVKIEKNGKLLKTYMSISEAASKNENKPNKNRIKKCCEENSKFTNIKELCKNGAIRSGYIWMFENDYNKIVKKKYNESYHIPSFFEFINE